MTVYVELVIFNNAAIDAFLTLAVLTARRRKISPFRVIAVTVIATCAAVWYAIAPEPWRIAVRTLLAPLCALIMTKPKDIKDYAVTLGVFAALTFALGGTITGINNLIGADIRGYALLGIAAAGLCFCTVALNRLLAKRSENTRKSMSVNVVFNGERASAKGMCDSGNTLCDALTGLPVVMLSDELARKLISGLNKPSEKIEGYIEVETVSGQASLPIIRLDAVEVDGKRMSAYGALTGRSLGEFDLILQNTMF